MGKNKEKYSINFLKSHADRFILSQSGFTTGSIVYDKKNQEFGFVAGKLDWKGNEFIKDLNTEISTDPTYLLITKRNWDIDEDKVLRCRYTKESFLELKLPGIELNSIKAIRSFCTNQCIQDCSEDCILWKFKKI